jgi:succinate dehydrogenase / fumarate reductase cytochrome b subunit
MSGSTHTLSSSIGKKLIMSLTGLFLCVYLIVHLGGNLQLFKHDGGQAFNQYAHFMTHFPPIKVISYLLYLSILVHTVYAVVLTINNRRARPIRYVNEPKSPSIWSSRNMGILGSTLFLFLVIHMGDFWFSYHNDKTMGFKEYNTDLATGETTVKDFAPASADFEYASFTENGHDIVRAKDLNGRVERSFRNPIYDLFYVIAMAALSFHLLHGFQSSFQTMGMNHRKYKPIVNNIGIWLFAVIIPIGFALMPIIYYFTR